MQNSHKITNIITKDIYNDLLKQFKALEKNYFKSDLVKEQIEKELQTSKYQKEISSINNELLLMDALHTSVSSIDPEILNKVRPYISSDNFYINYADLSMKDEEWNELIEKRRTDRMDFIRERIINNIKEKYGLTYWLRDEKLERLYNKINAIVATCANDASYDTIKAIVNDSIDLNAFLFEEEV